MGYYPFMAKATAKRHIPSQAGRAFSLNLAGRQWTLRGAGNLEDLWEAMGEENFDEDHIPYWTELWPSSLALAQWLMLRGKEIAGLDCLDLGCGLGLTALAGRLQGARVTGIDHEFDALEFCCQNAMANHVPQCQWLVMDWRRPAFRPHVFQRIWAADILYEKRFMAPVASFIEHCLAKDGIVWIAEPGRAVFHGFIDEVEARGWIMRKVYRADCLSPSMSCGPVTAAIWECGRKATAK